MPDTYFDRIYNPSLKPATCHKSAGGPGGIELRRHQEARESIVNADELLATTGHRQVDEIVASIVTAYEATLPNQALGYYLGGSWADGTAIDLSDIDRCILYETKPDDEEERQRAIDVWSSLSSPIHLDVIMRAIDLLPVRPIEIVSLKMASCLMYGRDVRDRLLWPSVDSYRSDATGRAYDFIGRVQRRAVAVPLPLAYPAPEEEFYGYDRKRVPWYPAGIERGLKELVTAVAHIATAILVIRTGRFVGSKAESVRVYRDGIGDEWTDYLDVLYQKGKHAWGYQVPVDAADRHLLRDLCQRTLGFEHYSLALYQSEIFSQSGSS